MKKDVFVIILIFLTINVFASSQESLVHEKALEVIKLTKADKMAELTLKQMVAIFKKSKPEISNEFWGKFVKEANYQEFTNMIADVYAKNYTVPELDAMIKFYKSPIGKEIIKKQPEVSKASMLAGQKWGKQLGMKIAMELQLGKLKQQGNEMGNINSIQKVK
ncbi:MAG TPA: DUF2059 domain-containing protein [Victivallales bacterium]|nr:DUF2059 domain-containing protein [Victivallales bacterium]